MRIRSNLHTHTRYGDGANTPEEMICAAIAKGFVSIGISEHAYAAYDLDCCIPADRMEAYRDEAYALKAKYADQIEVRVGLEVDRFGLHDKSRWDYVIGSVHYVKGKRGYHTLDHTAEKFVAAVDDLGSVQGVAEQYVASVVALAEEYRPDILGHLDVLTKLPRQGLAGLDTDAPWYGELWRRAIPRIAQTGCLVEVNTAPLYRGYNSDPYPARKILSLLLEHRVPVILSSDAHDAKYLDAGFEEALLLLRQMGFSSVMVWEKGRFAPQEL